MKPFLAFIGGFAAALGIFGAGAAVAVAFLAAEPVRQQPGEQNMAELWSAEPRQVDADSQDFQRVPGAAERASAGDTEPEGDVPEGIDTTTTAALPVTEAELPSEIDDEMMAPGTDRRNSAEREEAAALHIEWCAEKYRSYNPRDDSYTPYRGGRRPCVSPYSADLGGLSGVEAEASMPEEAEAYADTAGEPLSARAHYAVDGGGQAVERSADHVDYCFSRYRSYRPEDNTYQPYGGGPRRQCL